MTANEFIAQCPACGGNWTAMFIQGVQRAFPEVFQALPDREYTFGAISYIVNCLCDPVADTHVPTRIVDYEAMVVISPYMDNGIPSFKIVPLTEEEKDTPMTDLHSTYEMQPLPHDWKERCAGCEHCPSQKDDCRGQCNVYG